jgi:drug/metabolite transporter (DMT)-like permease
VSETPDYPPQRPLRALVLILIAGASFASVSAAIKAVGPEVGLAPAIWARGVVGVLVCLVLLRARGQRLRPVGWGMLTLRCLAGGAAMLCYYWALTPGMGNTDLPTAAMLLKTSPLWVAVLAPLVVRERPGARIWVALAVGLLGSSLRYGFSVEGEVLGVSASLVAGFLAALAYLALRALSRTDDPLTVVTVFSGFLLVAPLPFLGDALGSYAGWSTRSWVLLGAIGVLATAGQMALTAAYRAGSAAAVTIAGLTEIGMALGYSVGVFGEVPSAVALLGAGLAVGAGLLATSGRGARPSSPRTPPE